MAMASIPVDIFNPGQVLACMGFLEAADVLLGDAAGRFSWSNGGEPLFELQAHGCANPFEAVLEFLTKAKLQGVAPPGYSEQLSAPEGTKQPKKRGKQPRVQNGSNSSECQFLTSDTFPAREVDPRALPLRLVHNNSNIDMTHWCDGSCRNPFKLFAGQQRSDVIAQEMLDAIRGLWQNKRATAVSNPFGLTVPLGGSSFKFDPRKSWTGIDAGYSPDEQSHDVEASPVVEVLAAIGLEHARPDKYERRQVRYGVWGTPLPPLLARPALAGIPIVVPMRVFRFTLELAGKNKVVTFAQEEII
jgi:CRISPR-associated protein Csx14